MPDAPHVPAHLAPFVHADPARAFELSAIDPGDKPCSSGRKGDDRAAVESLAVELDALQNRFWADRRRKLLVVLQGTDTSGKDGTLRHVFGRMSPLGVRTAGWKAPNEVERAHDFLWRIHAAVPSSGEIVVFNRSHYEDVLVPVVNGDLDGDGLRQRLAQINDFERLLAETGTVVLKFMLHISRDEQRERLQARLDDPQKAWKFDPADLAARERWDDYQRAYQAALAATGTPWAPWIVVPADSKVHRNLMVATVLKSTLESLDLRFPPLPDDLRGVRVA
ncbi:MAG TPA: PPK2 family polyphosphate kinase [Ramlibacter sp.]|jgi:PPK2 family polyphosphate:nucleotide phosphotransferase|uniref:PPK2 family polyphosphate kinase n=1 Tax=Ramlibacter sp. TaxID=1917967 RepID=UPI002D5E3B28|nr:PPK2 family polyphosphate kinase [Ramlibacter sp.]HZY18754.1 PPK2 family polyphosphate kinase [Ramlibacter sp.]